MGKNFFCLFSSSCESGSWCGGTSGLMIRLWNTTISNLSWILVMTTFWVISKLACREALFLCVLQSNGGRHEAALGASQARESRSPEACLRSPVKHEKITPVRQANLKTSFFCRERCFSSCHVRVSLHEESNLRAPILYHWATETLLWERFITKSRWNASCILLRSAVSTVSFL